MENAKGNQDHPVIDSSMMNGNRYQDDPVIGSSMMNGNRYQDDPVIDSSMTNGNGNQDHPVIDSSMTNANRNQDHPVIDPSMTNANRKQDHPLMGSSMTNANRNQDGRYLPIGYVTDRQLSPSRSSPIGLVNPQSLISALPGLSLSSSSSSSSSESPYPQQRQQSTCLGDYFDGTTAELSNNQLPALSLERLNYPSDFMIDQSDFNSGFINSPPYNRLLGTKRNAQNQQNPCEMNLSRHTGDQVFNRFYQKHSSSLYNNKHLCRIPLKSPPHPSPTIPSLYDFILSDTGLGHNVPTVRSNSSNHHGQVGHVNLPLSCIRGEIMSCAKDQYMSIMLQDRFEFLSLEEIEMVMSEVIDHLQDLMTDRFGKHVFQKFIKACNEDGHSRILGTLCKPPVQLVVICQDPHGSRSVENLLEFLVNPAHISLITSSLATGILDLATGPHGHHVLRHCFKLFTSEDNKNLIWAIAQNFYQIATTRSGCLVLRTCVNESQEQFKSLILSKIIASTMELAEDPYGNYVLLHTLEMRIPTVSDDILNQLKGNFFSFSTRKFTSNVVQKCLSETEPAQAERVIIELIENPNIHMLFVDSFGYVVILSAIIASQNQVRARLLHILLLNLPNLRSSLYGRKILRLLDKHRIRLF